ncbi:Ethanolamine utilization protein EutQ [Bienertia sinuspersici]
MLAISSLDKCIENFFVINRWGCAPTKFPWTYDAKQTCYLLKGKVKVYPEGSSEVVEFGAGDLVVFPKGMSYSWDVSEAVDKHYKFE